MEYAMWALVGWCGNEPKWPPKPDPDPDPWLMIRVISVVGGLIGGYVFTQFMDGGLLVGAVGAFVGGRFLTDVAGRVVR